MRKFLFIITIFSLTLFTLPVKIFAVALPASVSFGIPAAVHVGDTFSVLVNASTGGETINSADVSLSYDTSLMSFVGYKDDNAVIKLWVQTPTEANGVVSMSGIIPGGASGLYDPTQSGLGPIPLVQLLFIAKGEGTAAISFTKSRLLKNDGAGTDLPHTETNGSVNINNAVPNQKNNVDTTPPLPFSITFVDSSFFSSTPPMVVFNANDTDSGIKNYQIKIGYGGWQNTASPAPVGESFFSRTIIVRAFDFYGNFQDASIRIPGIVPTKVLLVILAVLALCGILGSKLLKYKA